MTPAYNTDGAGYTDTGITISETSSGHTSKTRMIANGRIPHEAFGCETTYTNDGIWYNTKQFNYGSSFLSVNASCLTHIVPSARPFSCDQPAVA